jgi:hypothetical protein
LTQRRLPAAVSRPWVRHLAVLVGFLLLAILGTWPLATQFTTAVPGGGDAWQHLWNLWWMRQALTQPTDPFFTNALYYPNGVSLLFHTLVPLESTLTVPFQLLGVDLVPLYNSVLLGSFVLAGYGTWLLVRDLTGHAGAALVAGFAFAFCPYHLGHLLGHMNLASLQWIPFYLWALFRACGAPGSPFNFTAQTQRKEDGDDKGLGEGGNKAPSPQTRNTQHATDNPQSATHKGNPAGFRNPQWRWAALAGLFLAANGWTEWIYVAFLGVFTVGYVVWRAGVDGQLWAGRRAWGAFAARLLIVGVVFGALGGPLLIRTAAAQAGQTWMRFPPRETLIYSSDLVDSFVPSGLHPILGEPARALERQQPERNTAERSVFLGYTALLLALGALAWGRPQRAVAFWATAATVAWVLTLGPILHAAGRSTFTAFGVTMPLPYLLLYNYVPGFSVMRVPTRFIVLASLALAVLAGYALAALARRWPRPRWTALAVLATVAMAADFLIIPNPLARAGYQIPFYAQVAQEPGHFALLELPLRPMSDYLAYQTVHGKPLVYGYLSRQPPDPFVDSTPALHYLLNTTPPDALTPAEAAQDAQALRAANIRYVIVHWWAFTAPEAESMQAKLAALFPGQTPQDDPPNRMAIYRLGP